MHDSKEKSRARRRHRQSGPALGSGWVRRALWRGATAGLLSLALWGPAAANPSGAQVRHGTVTISPGQDMQIQQLTDKAIIDWRSFSIGQREAVRFLQPGQLSVILNRVVGVDPSTILGRLEGNGNVFLINPNGILFGPGSVVNVGGLVASTLNISDDDFLSGSYNFAQDPDRDLAAVVNQGTIRVTDGGYAVLCAPGVVNEGTIIARTGKVALLSGERSTLNLDGRDLVHYTLGSDVSSGSVLLAPGMMSDSLAATLGVPEARRADQLVRMPDGSVRLTRSSGTLVQNGTVSADGRSGEDAGAVVLDSADLTLVGDGSLTTASGQGADSNGGRVLVLSSMNGDPSDRGNSVVQEGSRVAARGGASGDGGLVEVSGDRVSLRSHPDMRATSGKNGLLLIDPPNVRIVDGSADGTATDMSGNTPFGSDWIITQLGMGDYVIQSTTDLLSQMTAPLDASATGGNLTLEAATTIDLGDDVYMLGGDMNLHTAGNVDLGSSQIDVAGNFRISGDPSALPAPIPDPSSIDLGSSVIQSQSAITLTSLGSILFDASNLQTSSGLDVNAGGEINLGTSQITSFDDSTFQTTTTGATLAPINFADASLTLSGVTSVIANGDVNLGTSDITTDGALNIQASTTSPATRPGADFSQAQIQADSLTAFAEGDLSLGSSSTQVQFNALLRTSGNLDTGTATVNAGLDPSPATAGQIVVDVAGNVSKGGSASTGYLAGDVVIFTSTFGVAGQGIDVNLNSSRPQLGNRIRLAANAQDGIFIRDLDGTGPTGGLYLVRRDSPNSTGGVAGSITSANGSIQVTSSGPVEFGLAGFQADGSTDDGIPLVSTATALADRTIQVSGSQLIDGVNFTTGGDPTREVFNPNGSVQLESFSQIGAAGGFDINVEAHNLAVSAGANGDVYVINHHAGVDKLAFLLEGGELFFTPAIGAAVAYRESTPGGPLVLDWNGTVNANSIIFVVRNGDLLVDTLDTNNQFLELKAVNGSVLDFDTASTVPNVSQNTPASTLIVSGQTGVGSAAHPFLVNGGSLAVAAGVGGIFLDSQGPLTLVTLATPAIFSSPAGSVAGAQAAGPIDISTASGALAVSSAVSSSAGSVLLDSAGALSATAPVSAGTGLVLRATGPIGTAALTAGGDLLVSTAGTTTLGGVTSSGGNATIRSTGSITVDQSLTANSGNVVLDTAGDIALNAPVRAGGTALLLADNAIAQNASGLVSSRALGIESRANLGSAADPFDFDSDTLTLLVADSAFLRSPAGPVSLTGAVSTGADTVSTGRVPGTLSLVTDNGSLTIDHVLDVGGALVLETAGSGDIRLNQSVTVGANANVKASGDISQATAATITASELGLTAGGMIGGDSGDFRIQAGKVALQSGGQAFLRQSQGNLELTGSVSAAGVTQNGGTVGGDMRVRLDQNGALTVSAPYQANNLALVTGSTLTTNQAAPSPSNIVVNANLSASRNLVLLSSGDIVGRSGTITAPNLGLGATGSIGSTGSPLSIATDNLSVNQTAPFLTDPNGFATTPSVTASGVTVGNRLQLATPAPPTAPPPVAAPPAAPPTAEPPTPVSTVIRVETAEPDPDGRLPEALSADNAGQVEEAIDEALFSGDAVGDEALLEWWEDESLLRKKNRF